MAAGAELFNRSATSYSPMRPVRSWQTGWRIRTSPTSAAITAAAQCDVADRTDGDVPPRQLAVAVSMPQAAFSARWCCFPSAAPTGPDVYEVSYLFTRLRAVTLHGIPVHSMVIRPSCW